MADFSDEENRRLVQLVRPFVKARSRVNWAVAAKKMKPRTWSPSKLRHRLKTLKRNYENNVLAFPRRLSLSSFPCVPMRKPQSKYPPAQISSGRPSPPRTCYSSFDSREIIPKNGCPISPGKQTRCARDQGHLNVGEITMEAISKLIEVANFEDNDVFLDVGSGIGNVLVQVALQTRAARAIGIEIQSSLVTKAMELITDAPTRFPHLLKIKSYEAVIRTITRGMKCFEPTSLAEPELLVLSTTTLLCHDVVFEEDANLAVRDLCVVLPFLRLVALTTSVCSRHRSSCLNPFCQIWELTTTLQVPMTYSSSLRQLYMYTTRAS
ncbi:hypothetical protein PHMEG_0007293 [Phytophthora megakarya]|uniref:Histone-lysine N-methyltransferase, H3 lysine-79 specific n=1 Tax=Phytophthora megakarya TaxID=4795 RepID=A0A225WP03_9STRA|nr:hypothetical protein PHMEG_0007293 [Phytophthora megakarya]